MNNNFNNPDGIDITIVAIAIFVITMLALVGSVVGISPLVTAAITVAIFAVYGVDLVVFSGRGTNFVLNWLQGRSPAYRERVLHHEAGHFLAAYLLGINIVNYNLDPLSAPPEMAVTGVEVDPTKITEPNMLSRYCTVWMAGIAAEQHVYANHADHINSEVSSSNNNSTLNLAENAWTGDLGATGGMHDMRQLKEAVAKLAPEKNPTLELRWALLRSRTLIQEHNSAYAALVEQMRSGAPLADCYGAINANLPEMAAKLG
jgi:hypothetical protein